MVAAALRKASPATETSCIRVLMQAADAQAIVGKKQGSTALSDLCQRSGAKIEVLTTPFDGSGAASNDEGDGNGNRHARVFSIRGADAQVEAAVLAMVLTSSGRQRDRHADFLASWPFETSYDDHFETPLQAYADVLPILRRLAKRRLRHGDGRKRSGRSALRRLRVFDPYYCTGGTRTALESLGCSPDAILHEKRDFYADVASGAVPPHDVFLTNPPYSADHKLKLLDYLRKEQRKAATGVRPSPFLLLLPAWVVGNEYWQAFLSDLAGAAARPGADHHGGRPARNGPLADLEREAGVFYVSPTTRYSFAHPEATGHDTSPFQAIWFCGGFGEDLKSAINSLKRARHSAAAASRVEVFRKGSMLIRRGHFVPARERRVSRAAGTPETSEGGGAA